MGLSARFFELNQREQELPGRKVRSARAHVEDCVAA